MLSAIFNGLKAARRRPTAARRDATSRRPLLESMEDRRLLSTYAVIDNVQIDEGNGGVSNPSQLVFTVSLLIPSSQTVTIDYQTADNSARAGEDYIPTQGTLTFAPGEMSKRVAVPVIGDSAVEADESVYLYLSNMKNGYGLINAIGVGTIVDDDTAVAPTLSVSDESMTRGFDGTVKEMNFTVNLNRAQSAPVTVRATTMDCSAIAGQDYEYKSELLTFAPGETSKTVTVKIYGNSALAPSEFFLMHLSESNASLTKEWGVGNMDYGA